MTGDRKHDAENGIRKEYGIYITHTIEKKADRQIPKRKGERVTLDSNILISGLVFDSKGPMNAIKRSTEEDFLMYTTIIHEEVLKFAYTDKCRISKEELKERIEKYLPDPILIEIPSDEKLHEMYYIKDDGDYKILYSAEATRSDVLVSGNKKHFFEDGVRGPRNIEIITLHQYLDRKTHKRSIRKRVQKDF